MADPHLDVTFLDADSGDELARASLPAGALPERLAPPRRVELKGRSYAVVTARPATIEKAAQAGRLEVRLREVPSGAYTVPTLAEELPRLDEGARREGRLLLLDSDEWRQVEVHSASLTPRVEEQLERIRQVAGETPPAPGFFAKLHVRGQHGPLLKGVELPVSEVEGALPPGTLRLDGIALEGEPGLVKDGFAFLTMNGLEVYGIARKGQVKVLALRPTVEAVDLGVESMGLAALMLRFGLSMVDWIRMRRAEAEASQVEPLLAPYGQTSGH